MKRLEEKLKKVLEIDSQLKQIPKLEEDINKLLNQINESLVNGEQLQNPILDYCLRYNYDLGIVEGENTAQTRLSKLEREHRLIKTFLNTIKDSKGQKVLEIYGEVPKEIGIINDPCKIIMQGEFNHRNIYIPILKHQKFNDKGGWDLTKEDKMWVQGDLFSYPALMLFNKDIWKTDHSKESYIGGPGPKETSLYIGNKTVKNQLKSISPLTTQKETPIQEPTF